MLEADVKELRNLERYLFRAWCRWLCYPSRSAAEEERSKKNFIQAAHVVDLALKNSGGPYFLGEQFSVVDCVFVPYVERMNASLFYYKGFTLRDVKAFPNISNWFDALETRETYLGTQSDFHTHCHDLPPQMGGCYENGDENQEKCKNRIDGCVDFTLPECKIPEPSESKHVALDRVLRHKEGIMAVNPLENDEIDQSLRSALTFMMTEKVTSIPSGGEIGLRYIRDRINVPRDMPIWSARRLREALEVVAASAGTAQGPEIPIQHRKDQDPKYFIKL